MNTKQAKAIRIDEYLSCLGYSPGKVGEKGSWYLSMLALNGEKTPSFQVSPDGHAFHDWSTGASGSIVDLAMYIIRRHDVSSALAHIEATMGRSVSASASCSLSLYQHKSLEILSVESLASPSLFCYAESRSIPANVISAYCKEVRYRNILTGKEYYSLGWPNDAGGWELRNRYSKLAAAPKDVSTINDLCDCTMLVFEGFFDFLSAVQMGWFRRDEMNCIVLNSTALVDKSFPILANANRVVCLLDNDDAGRKATNRILQFCPQAEDYSSHFAGCRDLNEYLMNNSTINKGEYE